MRNHLTPYSAHFFDFDFFLTVLGSESESSSEFLSAFFFEEEALDSFLAAGLNTLYSDLICCNNNMLLSKHRRICTIAPLVDIQNKIIDKVTCCSIWSMVFGNTKVGHFCYFSGPLFNEGERTDNPRIESILSFR